MASLETEKAYLRDNRARLLKLYGDRFLVIQGSTVLSAHDTYDEGVTAACAHGPGPFLVRSAKHLENAVSMMPALSLGLLGHARSQPPIPRSG